MDLRYFVLLIAMSASSFAVNVSIEGTLNIGEEMLGSLADRFLSSLGNSRRSMLPVQEDKLTSIIRHSLFEITSNCLNCSLYNFIEEYIIVLSKTMGKVLRKTLGSEFVEDAFEKQVTEYVGQIKELLIDSAAEKNQSFWIIAIKIINSKFQQLIRVYSEEVSSNVDKAELRYRIVLSTVIIENNYLKILCVEHDVCLTKTKFTPTLLSVLAELTKAPHKKIKTFLNSFYRALFDTRLYSLVDEELAHQMQVQLYEFVENPSRRVLLDFQKILEDHVNTSSLTASTPHHVDLMHAILSDLDTIYVVQSSAPFTEFLESYYVFLKSDVMLNLPKLLLEVQEVLSALASEFSNKLFNQVRVLLDILLNRAARNVPKVKPVSRYNYFP